MRKHCTSGVYLIIGERGVRIGQSGCMETRVPKAQRENEACIGKTRRVLQIPINYRNGRLVLERELIKALDPMCNIQLRNWNRKKPQRPTS
jgi:hypothetical protein